MRYLAYICALLFAACVLVLINMSDIDELALIEQAKQEQREHIRNLAAAHEAYRIFYNIKQEDL